MTRLARLCRLKCGKAGIVIAPALLPPAPACSFSLTKAKAIFERVHESIYHPTEVTRIGIEHCNPVYVESIRVTTQVPDVLHNHKCLVEVLVVDLRSLGDIS